MGHSEIADPERVCQIGAKGFVDAGATITVILRSLAES